MPIYSASGAHFWCRKIFLNVKQASCLCASGHDSQNSCVPSSFFVAFLLIKKTAWTQSWKLSRSGTGATSLLPYQDSSCERNAFGLPGIALCDELLVLSPSPHLPVITTPTHTQRCSGAVLHQLTASPPRHLGGPAVCLSWCVFAPR